MPKTPKKYSENISAALQTGTLAKIDELRGLRTRGEYVRDLVERAVSRLPENRPVSRLQSLPKDMLPETHEYITEELTGLLGEVTGERCYICAGERDEPQHH